MELAPAFPGGAASASRRLSLAGKAAQGVDGAAAGNDVCRSGDAYGLRRRIILSAIGSECPGDIDRYGKRHVGIDPAVRHSNTHGELEQNPYRRNRTLEKEIWPLTMDIQNGVAKLCDKTPCTAMEISSLVLTF